jgi:hypothetical protein
MDFVNTSSESIPIECDASIILLDIIDISNVDEKTFNNFMSNYMRVSEKLCINKNTGHRSQSIFQSIHKDYKLAKIMSLHSKIIYLYNPSDDPDNYEIVAFAVVSTQNNISDLDLLCSTTNKNIYKERKKLGIYLLDEVYSNVVEREGKVLKIRPATHELEPYYTKWKTPSLPMDLYKNNSTSGYLVYYGDIINVTDDTLKELVIDITLFDSLCIYLHIEKEEVLSIPTVEGRKDFLKNRIKDSSEYTDINKGQLYNMLERIEFFSIPELRDYIMKYTEEISSDGKKSRKYKKSKSRKYKKSKSRKYKKSK